MKKQTSLSTSLVKTTLFAFGLATTVTLPSIAYGVSFSIGASASDNNSPMQKTSSVAGSASIGFAIAQYLRLGYTHRQEVQESEGWEQETAQEGQAPVYNPVYNRTHVYANSLDASLILYQGVQFTPYLIGGGVLKNYVYDQHRENDEVKVKIRKKVSTKKPVPNIGAGVGMRISREFSLKLSYVASPGYEQKPNGDIKNVWDKYTTVQLGYDL